MTNNLVSIITPVAPYHADLLPRATASVEAQTVKCTHIVIHDDDGHGAGWARNRGLELAETPFVVFLDADDRIEPNFVEHCLRAYGGTRYIYTDYFDRNGLQLAPECLKVNRNFHCVTTLLPTAWARGVGGFDEHLLLGEDVHFYLKLATRGMCGKRLPHALFHYSQEGKRSRQYLNTPEIMNITAVLEQEFGGRMSDCGGCGSGGNSDMPINNSPLGAPQEGDILAIALWGGNHQKWGRVSGRLYPRSSYPKTLWVDPRDVEAMPAEFRRADEAPPMPIPAPPPVRLEAQQRELNGANEVAAFMAGGLTPQANTVVAMPTAEVVNVPTVERGEPRPNAKKVAAKARRGKR